MSSNLTKAKQYCCNDWSGNCTGAMMKRENGRLYMWIDTDLEGKPCIADKGCDYFNNIVVKSIPDEKPKRRKRI